MIKALIVDDEKLVRMGLIMTVPWKDFGIEIAGEANNGQKALDYIRVNEVDLLITDITMPGMSGLELMKEVRKSFPFVFIVVLTCHQDFDYIQECLRMGAIDYIVKTQMEDNKFDDSLKRIVERINFERQASASYKSADKHNVKLPDEAGICVPTESKSGEDDLAYLRKEWSSLIWVLNNSEFERIKTETKRSSLDISRLKSIFYKASAEWEASLMLAMPDEWVDILESARNWLDFEKWLEQVRIFIGGRINRTSYTDETVQIILKILSYLEENLTSDLSQELVAKKFNISRGYLSKAFKDIIGVNFLKHITDLRIKKAKSILVKSNEPVYQIAEDLGFHDEKYFSRMFKKMVGMTPVEYRSLKSECK